MVNNFDQKQVIHRGNFKNMNQEKFKEALASTSWNEILATYRNGSNISLGLLLKMRNSILYKYAPVSQITKKIQKTYSKSIVHHQSKIYRNLIVNLTKINKEKYYKTHFQEYKNNLCKTWRGIKITLVKKTSNVQPQS